MKLKDLTGQKFGRLTVVERDISKNEINKKKGKQSRAYWKCDCDCGTKDVIVEAHNLISENTLSSGSLSSIFIPLRSSLRLHCSSK